MDNLEFNIVRINEDTIMVEVMHRRSKESLGLIYMEKVKSTFQRKPISLNKWTIVDAKIEGLYEKEISITPKQIMEHCHSLVNLSP